MTARPEITGKKTGRRLLNYQALKQRGIPWSRVHIARLEAARKFPLHIDVGENSIAWFEDEIDDLLEMKAAERDAKARGRSPIWKTAPMADAVRPRSSPRQRQRLEN